MLEILSHQYLKRFMKSHRVDWKHIYSFGRIFSKSIEANETYLINSEIFSTKDWLSAAMIALFLKKEDAIFVLSKERIEFIKNNQLDDLKNLGFNYVLENNNIIFSNHRVCLITLDNLLIEYQSLPFKDYRIIFTGIENIKQDLRYYFRISVSKEDWFSKSNKSSFANQDIADKYNFLKKYFFLKRFIGKSYLVLDDKEVSSISAFFYENSSFSDKFLQVSKALSQEWASWVELDDQNLEWNFYLEPIDVLNEIKELLNNNKFVFLSALRKDNFFQNYLIKQKIKIDLVINFKGNFSEKKILLYVPPIQMLPNNPSFKNVILDKCKKLIIFKRGLTVFLSDDFELKTCLATELASHHGKRVLLETIPTSNNEILCASYKWWIDNSHLSPIPKQIVIPLLPIPNISEPINEIMVSHNKKLSKDWFRDFLLPEAIFKLDRSVAPLRRNSGKLIIFDGRANKRKWGRLLIQSIQPSKQIKYMLPFD